MMGTHRRTRTTPAPCDDRLDDVLAWIDGDLPAARARAVTAHVAGCPGCASLVDELRLAIAACRQAGDCRVPSSIHRRARTRARAIIRRG